MRQGTRKRKSKGGGRKTAVLSIVNIYLRFSRHVPQKEKKKGNYRAGTYTRSKIPLYIGIYSQSQNLLHLGITKSLRNSSIANWQHYQCTFMAFNRVLLPQKL